MKKKNFIQVTILEPHEPLRPDERETLEYDLHQRLMGWGPFSDPLVEVRQIQAHTIQKLQLQRLQDQLHRLQHALYGHSE